MELKFSHWNWSARTRITTGLENFYLTGIFTAVKMFSCMHAVAHCLNEMYDVDLLA